MRRFSLMAAVAVLLWLMPLAPSMRAAQAGTPLATARQQYQAGHFANAAATLQGALQQDAGNAALHFWLGRCYFELRNFDNASPQFEQAVKLDEQNSEYHMWLGRTYGRLADSHRSLWLGMKTRKEFEKAVELDPRNIPARRDLEEFYTNAPWIVGGSKKKAREQIAAIAALDPIQGDLAQAEFNRQTGDLAGAEAAYRKVLKQDPPRPTEYFEVGDFYAKQQNAKQLQRVIDGVVRVAPDDPRLGYYRGVVLTIEGQQLSEAESYLKAYLAATVNRTGYPSHADARTWLGHVYEKLGRRLEAAEQYRAALEIDPNSSFAKNSLKRLEKQQVN
jgi:tetratricopeptide (TPR) repeat protein